MYFHPLKILDEEERFMNNYITISSNGQEYIYDSFDNVLREISVELSELIRRKKRNKRYYELINKHNIRDVLNDEKLQIVSPITQQENVWKIENKQKHLVLSLTEKCNMRCEYCGYRNKYDGKHSLTTMSEETMKKAIIQFINHSKCSEEIYISFYGGEPLIEKNRIKSAVNYCEQNHFGQKIRYCITTNGLALNEDFIDFLVENKFLVIISLDGPQYIHDRYRKDIAGEKTYETIIENIKIIKKKYPLFYQENIMFNAVMAPPHNFDIISDFFEFSKVNMMELKNTDYFEKYLNERDININEYILEHESPMYDIMLTIKELKKFHIISKDSRHVLAEPCGYCLPFCKRIFVDPRGRLLVCEKVDETCERYNIGDVDNWINYEKLAFLLEETAKNVKSKCCDCWAIRFCNTCFMNEDEMKKDKMYCNDMRNKIKQEYKKYIELLQNEPELVSLFSKFSID